MNTARRWHTATLLPSGKVLVVGGTGSPDFGRSAELYDPTTGTWSATGSTSAGHTYEHTATLLPSGKVLVAGGPVQDTSTELYDPITGRWSITGRMVATHRAHTATLLRDGTVLIAGGEDLDHVASRVAELYDPTTGAWRQTGSTMSVGHQTATLLSSGKVLVAGGRSAGGLSTNAELYDPGARQWTQTGSLTDTGGFSTPTATVLLNGKVFLTGSGYLGGPVFPNPAQLYDPASGSWSAVGTLSRPRGDHSATLLPNGKVLIAGGLDNSRNVLASAELYNPTTGVTAPFLTITPSGGSVGTVFNFRGTGFAPGGTATQHIRWPDGSEHLGVVLTDASGGLSWSYTSRCSDQLGTYTITVSDDATGASSNAVQEIISASGQCAGTPGAPQFLGQEDSKGDIPFGGSSAETTVTLRGALSFPSAGSRVKLQVELRRLDEFEGKFLYQATQESQLGSSYGSGFIPVYGLVPGRYHWQARNVSENGKRSAWAQAGNNDLSSADFTIEAVPSGPTQPQLTGAGVVNGASFKTNAVAPGTIISLFGTNLATSTLSSLILPLPTQLGGTSVTFDSFLAPLLFVSPQQINLQVPYEITGSTVTIVVNVSGQSSRPLLLSTTPVSLGMFSRSQTGTGEAAILDAGFRLVTSNNPASPGDTVSIYATGLGQVSPPIASGSPAETDVLHTTVVQPTVLVDGLSARVTFSGLTPSFVGLYQINFEVPQNVARGTAVSVSLMAKGQTGNPVTMATSSVDGIPPDIRPILERIASALDTPPVAFWFQIHGLGPVLDLFGFVFKIYKIREFSQAWPDPQFKADLIDSIYRIDNNPNTKANIDDGAWQGCAKPRWSDLSAREKLEEGCQFEVLTNLGDNSYSGVLLSEFAKRLLE